MREKMGRIGTIAFGCAMAMPFVGVAAFFFGAGWLTVAGGGAALVACSLTAVFDDGLTWMIAPVGLGAGGLGALLAWIFGWRILYCAAFAACLVVVLIFALFFLMMVKMMDR